MDEREDEDPHLVTRLIARAASGRDDATEELLRVVYSSLHGIARRQMSRERGGHTLEPTALVHEAWIRLRGDIEDNDWASRRHFYGAAANAMRRVLIDHARSNRAEKRGGGRRPLSISNVLELVTHCDAEDVVMVDDLISRLEAENERVGKVVGFRFFAGMSIEDVARVLGVSKRTVNSDWEYARAWLIRELSRD